MNKQQIQQALPWYVNGSLDAEQREAVEAALAEDSEDARELADELAFLKQLRQHIKQQTAQASPGETGLYRLRRELRRESAATATSARWWKPMAIAASLLLVVQTGYMLTPANPGSGITPLSGSQYNAPVLQIQFRDDAANAAIQSLLLAERARIIDGPSVSGLYRIVVDDGDIAATLSRLKRNQLVTHVAQE